MGTTRYEGVDGTFTLKGSPEDGASRMTEMASDLAAKCIKKKKLTERKSTHPWLNERVTQAVDARRKAQGTPEEKTQAAQCSIVILEEYNAWCRRAKEN